jgi:opacity protein-like surface antigen
MNKSFAKHVFLGIAALALPSVMAHAADGPNFFVGGGLLGALDSTKTITHNSLGFNITGGTEVRSSDGTYGFRPGVAVYFLPGSEKEGVKTSLNNFQIYGDIVFDSGIKNLAFTAGLSVQRWYYKTTAAAGIVSPLQLDDKGFLNGTKLGLRLGVEYRVNKNISAELLFQQTDFGSKDGEAKGNVYSTNGNFPPPTPAQEGTLISGSNATPAWIQMGVKYHF